MTDKISKTVRVPVISSLFTLYSRGEKREREREREIRPHVVEKKSKNISTHFSFVHTTPGLRLFRNKESLARSRSIEVATTTMNATSTIATARSFFAFARWAFIVDEEAKSDDRRRKREEEKKTGGTRGKVLPDRPREPLAYRTPPRRFRRGLLTTTTASLGSERNALVGDAAVSSRRERRRTAAKSGGPERRSRVASSIERKKSARCTSSTASSSWKDGVNIDGSGENEVERRRRETHPAVVVQKYKTFLESKNFEFPRWLYQ